MDNKKRIIIVDDEQPARDKLALFLSSEADFEVVGEAKDGIEALQKVDQYQPDVVFLDIQMPRLDGLSVAMNLQQSPQIKIVFVTGFNDYAVKAFEINAIDYLLKPFDKGRLKNTLARLREPSAAIKADSLSKVLQGFREQQSYPTQLMFKTDNAIEIVAIEKIEWVESSGNYVKLCLKDHAFIARQTLNAVECQLDPNQFARIHRSHLVNLAMIEKVIPLTKGDFNLVLKNATLLKLSRSFKDQFFEKLKRQGFHF